MRQNIFLNTLMIIAIASFSSMANANEIIVVETATQAEMARQAEIAKMAKRAAVRKNTARAHSNDKGFYVGVGAARSGANGAGFDESETEAGLRAGYMFNRRFGIDVTAVELGAESSSNLNIDADVVALSLITKTNLGRAALYSKLGVAEVNLDLKNSTGTIRSDSSDTEFFWGIGAEYNLGKVDAFIEYNRVDTDNVDIDSTMLGLKYKF